MNQTDCNLIAGQIAVTVGGLVALCNTVFTVEMCHHTIDAGALTERIGITGTKRPIASVTSNAFGLTQILAILAIHVNSTQTYGAFTSADMCAKHIKIGIKILDLGT